MGRILKNGRQFRLLNVGILLIMGSLALSSCGGQLNSNNKQEQITNIEKSDMKTINLTKTDFLAKVTNYETSPNEWKYIGDKPALIDFYADWCGPCKAIAPVLEELAKEYDGQIYIYKINTEEQQELASVFGIRSIPSLLFVPMNGEPQMAQGALPKDQLKKAINEVLLVK